ncbi:LTA synthase family protein [Halalkalibacter hemicellulosilyticus]|uniref:Lipoteichoic acid synthase LtaS Type IIIa n=1 Tax=Halalkalibacter hemicellulosilyticusJCM 9152 TaxID=1236971 RepID=W4QFF9_9BACI|nr:lipoteichoic acid synthase LtaS Type IIIa [Halalkalibacter hemicellulosilyticusJCM 9152]
MASIIQFIKREKMMWLVFGFIWLKTYLFYKLGFQIQSESIYQEFLLLINPISSTILLLGLCFLIKKDKRPFGFIGVNLLATIILYANVLYYRFFNDFLTLPVLVQTSNISDVQGSIAELIRWWDALFFVDILVLVFVLMKRRQEYSFARSRVALALTVVAVGVFVVNLSLAQAERPQLLTRSFDRELLVKNIGVINYHAYDAYIQSHSKAQRAFADSSEINEIIYYTREQYREPNEEYFGLIEGKNVMVISLESLQSFVIEQTMNGEVVTPFLNELIEESIYFDHFYHQTEQGKTSDSEFVVDNSLFGRNSGAVFFTHSNNEYNALPEQLGEIGYYTSVMHANNKSFWNRDMMYLALGYERFFDIQSYDVTEENSVGWGLKDLDFFEQSIDLLKQQPEPYYTKFITLTNHFPFELDEEDRLIEEYDSYSGTLNRYFPTVRYMDHALEQFFERLKDEGMYEDTVFIMYGDHYGISSFHDRSMAMYLEKDEITDFDTVQLQRVPLIIHIPGMEGKRMDTVSGQIDLKPTMLHLLGVETEDMIYLGTDLFSDERESFVVLRNGSFVTDDYLYTSEVCYDKQTEQETDMSYCEPYFDKARQDLHYSDRVIYGDLLRFFERNE